jgi:hypothetical protein
MSCGDTDKDENDHMRVYLVCDPPLVSLGSFVVLGPIERIW